MNLAFLVNVEKGYLEHQALLLCKSIREFCGRFADSEIHAFSPRPGFHPSEQTFSRLRELGVICHLEELNKEFSHYGIGNKILVSSAAEKFLSQEILVLLDSDSFFTQEPALFDLSDTIYAAARPADEKNMGSSGPGDRNEENWKRLYELCGIDREVFVETPVDQKRIRAYFNAGLVVDRRSVGLFSNWERDFRFLMAAEFLPKNKSLNNLDQFALAATLTRVFENVSLLDWRYNYPLGRLPVLSSPANRAELEDLIHVHYHRWFNRPNFLRLTSPPFSKDSSMMRWLEPQLPFLPTIDTPLRYIGV